MTRSSRQSALTLVEILAVLGIMVILFAIGAPAAKKIIESFDSSANVRSAISAALSHARSIAMSEGTWAGLRFQQDKSGRQYMILIQYNPIDIVAGGAHAVANRKPMKLPESIAVMDRYVVTRTRKGSQVDIVENLIQSDDQINEPFELTDTNTFTILFSKEGKLATHEVWVRNRDNIPDTMARVNDHSLDDIFNKKSSVDEVPPIGLFYQDDYFENVAPLLTNMGLGPENSRNSFVIYDKKKFKAVPVAKRWSLYLKSLPLEYVNPSSGELVGMR